MKILEISKKIRKIMRDVPPPDERELVRRFLAFISKNHRTKYYLISQNKEAELGADFLWVIFSNRRVSAFLVQAKKLKSGQHSISRKDASCCSRSGVRQVDILCTTAEKEKIPAIYMLFSKDIQFVPCGHIKPLTDEGIFVDTAYNVMLFASKKKDNLRHFPLSCFFSCFSFKCHYFEHHRICKVCKSCDIKNFTAESPQTCKCPIPFDRFLSQQFGMDCPSFPMSDNLLPLVFAETILKKKPQFVINCLSQSFVETINIPSKIIITDYFNRHEKDYLHMIMGSDFIIDEEKVLSQHWIISILKTKKNEYGLFKKIGLFGSYSRNEAKPSSDIDIALVYNPQRFQNYESILKLVDFIKEILATFQKNVDFLDYFAANEYNNEKFITTINNDMIWI